MNNNGNGKRKIRFALAVEIGLMCLALAGAIPRFEYLQAVAPETIKAIIWVAGLFMAGNGTEHLAPYIPALFGKK